MAVEVRTRKVYYSPRRGRHFFTAEAAAKAEASARIKRFFPTEKPDDAADGFGIDPGWHFSEVPRLVTVQARLFRRYLMQLNKEPK